MSQYLHLSSCSDNNSSIPGSTSAQSCWSELIPPFGGLAFAALWDPDAGTVTLSSAKSFAPSKDRYLGHTDDVPSDVDDHQSQSLTAHFSGNTEALAAFQEPDLLLSKRETYGSPLPSSTDHGLDRDIYFRNSRRTPKACHYSCFDKLDEELCFDPRTAFAGLENLIFGGNAVEDEGFFEGRGGDGSVVFVDLVLPSSFSTTTTSTSNYVDVRRDLYSPQNVSLGSEAFRRERLRKRRPGDIPAKPSRVLAREMYNFVAEPSHSARPVEGKKISNFVRMAGLGYWKKRSQSDDRWVKVDVTQVVTQSLVEI